MLKGSCISMILSSNYTLLAKLGEGTFACVYKAKNNQTHELVAIKQISIHPLQIDDAYDQVHKLQTFQNDHIVKYKTSFYDSNQHFLNMVLQLCHGSVRGDTENKTYSYKLLLSFVVQITSGFLQLMEKKVMHLDLKPQNILIANQVGNYFKICDFGCSQMAIKSKLSKYNNPLFGTFNYLAPEAHINFSGRKTNSSADIWSFGIILYEIIYKKLPFPLDSKGIIDRKILEDYFHSRGFQIDFNPIEGLQDIIKIIRVCLYAKPANRLTWTELKEKLIKDYRVQDWEFMNVKKIYYLHMSILKLFLSVYMLLKKNVEFNPHKFWRSNKKELTELKNTLVHICYLYTIKFQTAFSYKTKNCLSKEEIENVDFINRHIEYEEFGICKTLNCKLSAINELSYFESIFAEGVKQLAEKLKRQTEDYWDAMQDLDAFFAQILVCWQQKSSFFAHAQKFPASFDNFQIKK